MDNVIIKKVYVHTVSVWPEEVIFWHEILDREQMPAGTLKERVKALMDSHYTLRFELRKLTLGDEAVAKEQEQAKDEDQ